MNFTNIQKDQGQGGAQAIEDAVALGIVLSNFTPGALEERLQIYEDIRRIRASVMAVFSNAGQDEPGQIRAEAAKFMPAEDVPSEFLRMISSQTLIISPTNT